jgi:hypothetical protein
MEKGIIRDRRDERRKMGVRIKREVGGKGREERNEDGGQKDQGIGPL